MDWSNEKDCLLAVKRNGFNLKNVKIKTYEVCLEAIKSEGLAIAFVDESMQTDELCLLAVKNDGRALQFIKNQTEEICLSALKEDELALPFLNISTPNLRAYIKAHFKSDNDEELTTEDMNNISAFSVA